MPNGFNGWPTIQDNPEQSMQNFKLILLFNQSLDTSLSKVAAWVLLIRAAGSRAMPQLSGLVPPGYALPLSPLY